MIQSWCVILAVKSSHEWGRPAQGQQTVGSMYKETDRLGTREAPGRPTQLSKGWVVRTERA